MGCGRSARTIEHGIKRVAHLRLKKVAYAAIPRATRIRRSYRRGDLGQQSRRDEIAVVCAGPRQMGASVRGVVHAEHDLAGKQPLDPQIPHVNVGVSRRRRAQIVRVRITPVRKLAVLRTLRTAKASRKRILQGRGLGGEIVVRKKQVRGLAGTPRRDTGSLWPGSFRNRCRPRPAPPSADRVGTRNPASAQRLSSRSEPSSCSTSGIALCRATASTTGNLPAAASPRVR